MASVRLLALCAVFAMASASGASASTQTLAVCGAVKGHAYYAEGGLVPKKEAGWSEDAISGGKTTLSRNDKGDYDIVFADSTGGTFSSVAEGGAVIAVRHTERVAVIIVAYPSGTVEVYQFVRDGSGAMRMLQTQNKGMDQMTKAAVYSGDCSYMRLTK